MRRGDWTPGQIQKSPGYITGMNGGTAVIHGAFMSTKISQDVQQLVIEADQTSLPGETSGACASHAAHSSVALRSY